jgi:hypothetical protein
LFVGLVVIDAVLDRENHGSIPATAIGNRLIPEPTPNQFSWFSEPDIGGENKKDRVAQSYSKLGSFMPIRKLLGNKCLIPTITRGESAIYLFFLIVFINFK